LAAPAAADPFSTESLSWMRGHWLSCADGGHVEESWIGAGTEAMVGSGVTRGAGFEVMWIAPDGAGAMFWAQPGGQAPATGFAMIEQGERSVAFENAAHDFPQRIRYWRDGGRLHARIEGELQGEAASMEWSYRRAGRDERCPRD